MKAIILCAGFGSRLRPLTEDSHKSLLPVGDKSILYRMLQNCVDVGITDVAFVTGYRADDIMRYVSDTFPTIKSTFIHNAQYEVTNTAYSLSLCEQFVNHEPFIKFDADVVFEKAVLEALIASSYDTCLCIDTRINLDAEEVKVTTDESGLVLSVGKKLDPHTAKGESIGIEKIGADAGDMLFEELKKVLLSPENQQEYYDDSYTTLVDRGVRFGAVDITGLKWVEVDTHDDYKRAQELFA